MEFNERLDPSRQQIGVLCEICDYVPSELRISVHTAISLAFVYDISSHIAKTIREEAGRG